MQRPKPPEDFFTPDRLPWGRWTLPWPGFPGNGRPVLWEDIRPDILVGQQPGEEPLQPGLRVQQVPRHPEAGGLPSAAGIRGGLCLVRPRDDVVDEEPERIFCLKVSCPRRTTNRTLRRLGERMRNATHRSCLGPGACAGGLSAVAASSPATHPRYLRALAPTPPRLAGSPPGDPRRSLQAPLPAPPPGLRGRPGRPGAPPGLRAGGGRSGPEPLHSAANNGAPLGA